jgi:hypothetical protein
MISWNDIAGTDIIGPHFLLCRPIQNIVVMESGRKPVIPPTYSKPTVPAIGGGPGGSTPELMADQAVMAYWGLGKWFDVGRGQARVCRV